MTNLARLTIRIWGTRLPLISTVQEGENLSNISAMAVFSLKYEKTTDLVDEC